jgi:predicted alpha/beta superfamily hydrolase
LSRSSPSPLSRRTKTRTTIVEVAYPATRGRVGIRGSAPLSWNETTKPTRVDGDRHVFELRLPEGELVDLKLVRNDDEWAGGRNYVVHAGECLLIEPAFEHAAPRLLPPDFIEHDGHRIDYRVLLPPSYDEQEDKRYPVIYAQDGQSLWSVSNDPFGIWGLDLVFGQLYEIGAMEEVIVVGIDTATARLERLSPVPDPEHGGGEAMKHLEATTEGLLPRIESTLRARTDRASRALLGSSMGGLFSFFGAWSRPDLFGKAMCLSSSFWWSHRAMIRMVQEMPCPAPRPVLYLDSGASISAHETDVGLRDGFHHTRSMVRALVQRGFVLGDDLHRLVFTGERHDAAAWAARIAIPLQIMFPLAPGSIVPEDALPEVEDG